MKTLVFSGITGRFQGFFCAVRSNGLPAISSANDRKGHVLSVAGATVGATKLWRTSLVPVALAVDCSLRGSFQRGSEGSASTARSTSSSFNCIWVADITYIPLENSSFAYLALLLDLCSRRVIGWSLDDQMTEQLVLAALQQAIRSRQPPTSLIHHSDRGGQYAGRGYRALLRRAAIRQSMSRATNCYDNASMESCFGTIKTELEMTEYQNKLAARHDIASYLAYYNCERRHSSLDYLSPASFEAQLPAQN